MDFAAGYESVRDRETLVLLAGVGAALQPAMRCDSTRCSASRRMPRRPRRSVCPEEKGRGGCLARFHDDQSLPEIVLPTPLVGAQHPPKPLASPPLPNPSAFPAPVVAFPLTCSLRDYTAEARRLFNVTLPLSRVVPSCVRLDHDRIRLSLYGISICLHSPSIASIG